MKHLEMTRLIKNDVVQWQEPYGLIRKQRALHSDIPGLNNGQDKL